MEPRSGSVTVAAETDNLGYEEMIHRISGYLEPGKSKGFAGSGVQGLKIINLHMSMYHEDLAKYWDRVTSHTIANEASGSWVVAESVESKNGVVKRGRDEDAV